MHLKFFLFKMILIFNIVVVYSISCEDIQHPGKHIVGSNTIFVGSVTSIFNQNGYEIYKYHNTFLKYNNGEQIRVNACIVQNNGESYLDFDTIWPSHKTLNITNL